MLGITVVRRNKNGMACSSLERPVSLYVASIIRILLMIIWYSVWNFQAAVYFKESVYLLAAAGSYAPIAFSSFFALMVTYLKYDLLVDQQRFFRERRPPKNWKWPVTMLQKCTGGQYRGPSRRPLSAVIWFNVIMLVYSGSYIDAANHTSDNLHRHLSISCSCHHHQRHRGVYPAIR